MAKLTFRYAPLAAMISTAALTRTKQLVLAGDHGAYFMTPKEQPPRAIVYAHE